MGKNFKKGKGKKGKGKSKGKKGKGKGQEASSRPATPAASNNGSAPTTPRPYQNVSSGQSPSGEPNRPPCRAHYAGKCPNGATCRSWHMR